MKYNKGFISVGLILAIILGLVVVGGGTYYLVRNNSKTIPVQIMENNILPDSFTMEVHADNSSSGAGRVYEGELTFKNNKLINGFQNYKVSQGGGCKTDCEKYTECIIKNQQWIDKISGGECKMETFVSNTKNGIEQQIKNKEMVQSDDFVGCHYSTCYKIKDSTVGGNQINNMLDNNVPITIANECLPTTIPWIKVLSPNGGEVFTAGQQVAIKWTSCNVQNVWVGLASGGKDFGEITYPNPVPASQGSYQWTVSNPARAFTQLDTNSYQIGIESQLPNVFTKSGTFSVHQ